MKKRLSLIAMAILCPALLLSACSGGEGRREPQTPVPQENQSEKTGKRVYFAGPLFNQAEKDFNARLAKVLEDHGYQVFLPQRDGIEAALLEGKTEEELVDMIFSLDAGEVKKADILFMNLDGRVPDEGACVELGIAYASGKRCYGFKTDTRAVELGMDLNPMITGCMTRIFHNFDGDKLIGEIEEYLSKNEL